MNFLTKADFLIILFQVNFYNQTSRVEESMIKLKLTKQ